MDSDTSAPKNVYCWGYICLNSLENYQTDDSGQVTFVVFPGERSNINGRCSLPKCCTKTKSFRASTSYRLLPTAAVNSHTFQYPAGRNAIVPTSKIALSKFQSSFHSSKQQLCPLICTHHLSLKATKYAFNHSFF